MQKQEKQFTSYSEAVKELDLVLCNNITQHHELSDYTFRIEDYIDDEIIEEVNNDDFYETEEEKEEAIKEKAYEKFYNDDIFQYFLTNARQSDVEYLTKTYGLIFAYCDDLDLYVLLVNHWGTSWRSVEVEVK